MKIIISMLLVLTPLFSVFANQNLSEIKQIVAKSEHKYHLQQEQKEKLQRLTPIQQLAKKYDIVFFFYSTCPHCHNYYPVLKAFSEQNGFDLYPYSGDKKPMPGEPNFLVATPRINNMFFGTYSGKLSFPVTFLVNKNNINERYWIGIGELSRQILNDKFNQHADALLRNNHV